MTGIEFALLNAVSQINLAHLLHLIVDEELFLRLHMKHASLFCKWKNLFQVSPIKFSVERYIYRGKLKYFEAKMKFLLQI